MTLGLDTRVQQDRDPCSKEGLTLQLHLPSMGLIPIETERPGVPWQRNVTAFLLACWEFHKQAMASAPQHMLHVVDVQREVFVNCNDNTTSPLLQLPNLGSAKPRGELRYAPTGFLREFDVGVAREFPHNEFVPWA